MEFGAHLPQIAWGGERPPSLEALTPAHHEAAARVLGACNQRAILLSIGGGAEAAQPLEDFAAGVVRTLLAGIGPEAGADPDEAR